MKNVDKKMIMMMIGGGRKSAATLNMMISLSYYSWLVVLSDVDVDVFCSLYSLVLSCCSKFDFADRLLCINL